MKVGVHSLICWLYLEWPDELLLRQDFVAVATSGGGCVVMQARDVALVVGREANRRAPWTHVSKASNIARIPCRGRWA